MCCVLACVMPVFLRSLANSYTIVFLDITDVFVTDKSSGLIIAKPPICLFIVTQYRDRGDMTGRKLNLGENKN